jgi:hypothetical protein
VGGDPASGEVGVGTRVGVGRGEVVDEELIGLGAAEGVDRAPTAATVWARSVAVRAWAFCDDLRVFVGGGSAS